MTDLICANPHGRFSYRKVTAENAIEGMRAIDQKGLSSVMYWWIDAGWYKGNHWEQTGTWEHDPDRFPRGLLPIADATHEVDRKFVLWFEPERIRKGSLLYENHKAWLLEEFEHDQRLLDLGNPEAPAWAKRTFSGLIEQHGVDVYRHDFNHPNPLDAWRAADAENRVGITEIRYVTGLYDYSDALQREAQCADLALFAQGNPVMATAKACFHSSSCLRGVCSACVPRVLP